MQDEIFGPVLPIVTVDSVDDAVEFVNARYLRALRSRQISADISCRVCRHLTPSFDPLQGQAAGPVRVHGGFCLG